MKKRINSYILLSIIFFFTVSQSVFGLSQNYPTLSFGISLFGEEEKGQRLGTGTEITLPLGSHNILGFRYMDMATGYSNSRLPRDIQYHIFHKWNILDQPFLIKTQLQIGVGISLFEGGTDILADFNGKYFLTEVLFISQTGYITTNFQSLYLGWMASIGVSFKAK